MSLPRVAYPKATVVLDVIFDDAAGSTATFPVTPISVEVIRNDARHADTAVVEIDFRDFPLDPRLLRDVHIQVYLAGVPGPQAPLPTTPDTLRFVGRVDVPESELGEDGQIVRLEARDYTGIWLDTTWPPSGADSSIPTPAGKTLGAVVEHIRKAVTPDTAQAVFSDPLTESADVAAQTGRAEFVPDSDEESAWDVLSSLCDRFGLVPVWDRHTLTIRTPIESRAGSANMVYGANVSKLSFKRSFKQQKQKHVKLVAWNPMTGRVLSTTYPEVVEVERLDATDEGEAPKKSKKPQQVQYNVQGPYDARSLEKLAEVVHTELSRQQLEGELETRDLVDLLGGDLLALQNGDRLICRLGPQDHASIAGMSDYEAINYLSDPRRPNSVDFEVALALVKAWSVAQARGIEFYILEVMHSWSRDDGYRFTAQFSDFVLGV